MSKIDNSTCENPYRYNNQYYDNESGYIYLRARYYDPATSRFISEDPFYDGNNWYVYAANNPIMYHDPSGLSILAILIVGGILIGGSENFAHQMHNNNYDVGAVNYGEVAIWGAAGGVAGLGTGAFAVGSVALGTATLFGAGVSTATNISSQLVANGGDWSQINATSVAASFAGGGLSGALGVTGLGMGWQAAGNAAISGLSSKAQGGSDSEVLFNTALGGIAGLIGGNGAGCKPKGLPGFEFTPNHAKFMLQQRVYSGFMKFGMIGAGQETVNHIHEHFITSRKEMNEIIR